MARSSETFRDNIRGMALSVDRTQRPALCLHPAEGDDGSWREIGVVGVMGCQTEIKCHRKRFATEACDNVMIRAFGDGDWWLVPSKSQLDVV